MRDLWDWLRGYRVLDSGFESTQNEALQMMHNILSPLPPKQKVIFLVDGSPSKGYLWVIKAKARHNE